ncbi:MAG: ABC transporter ATP-binding protein [Casimicrobiaceae bacterium]
MGAITVSGLGKAYREYASKWGRLREWLVPWAPPAHTLKWVLRDVSFSVSAGEVVGIVGVNGAGKSTLLKILAGTTQPTTGVARVEGRVAAMLELGIGFHPDFTGRQNALLSGQLIGIPAEVIVARFHEVEAFAEIGPYFDQPLRVYSSGMMVRLAFSLATLVRPEILIVDEALAVGDAFFQVKSFARIKQFKELGTTILFVSHDVGTIKSICDRAILISNGQIERDGSAVAVADYYSALINSRLLAEHIVQNDTAGAVVTRSGTRSAEVTMVRVVDAEGRAKGAFLCGERMRVEVEILVRRAIAKVVQGFLIRDRRGQDVYGTNTFHLDRVIADPPVGGGLRFTFEFCASLAEGVYSVSVATVDSDTVLWENFDWIENATMFKVIRSSQPFFIGVASLEADCTVSSLPIAPWEHRVAESER